MSVKESKKSKCILAFEEKVKAREALKKRARNAVTLAIRRGELIRPAHCEACGAEGKVDAHHEDYSKPLIVDWLCKVCHIIAACWYAPGLDGCSFGDPHAQLITASVHCDGVKDDRGKCRICAQERLEGFAQRRDSMKGRGG